jgi:hypothetical protein
MFNAEMLGRYAFTGKPGKCNVHYNIINIK